MSRRVAAVTAVVVAIACRDMTTAPPPEPCNGAIAVQVQTAPASPLISWTPICGISSLTVSTVATAPEQEQTVWGLTVSEQYPIGPAIKYGDNPSGANVWVEPQSLVVGKMYRVQVMYTVGGDVVVAGGSATFTWFPPD